MFTRAEKILLFTLAFIQFSHIVDFMILMPLGPQLMRILVIDPHQFGLLVSAYTFAAGTTGLLSSMYIDRYDRKHALLFFYIGFCVSTFACAVSWNYHSLLIARTVAGAFGGVLGSLIMAIVSDSIDYKRRGAAMGTVMTSFSIASIFGVPLSLQLANMFGWNAPFMFLAVLSTLMIFVIWFKIPNMGHHLVSGEKHATPLSAFTNVLKNNNQLIALAFYVLLIFGHFAIIPFLSPSLVANAGLDEKQLPLVYLVGGIVSIIASPLIGKVSDIYGKAKIFRVAAAISVIPIFLITHLFHNSVFIILSLVAFLFLCMGARMIPASAMMSGTVKPKNRGSFMSITAALQQFSAALASYIAGIIVVKDAEGHLLHYQTVGYIAMAFSVFAIIASLKIQVIEAPSENQPDTQSAAEQLPHETI